MIHDIDLNIHNINGDQSTVQLAFAEQLITIPMLLISSNSSFSNLLRPKQI